LFSIFCFWTVPVDCLRVNRVFIGALADVDWLLARGWQVRAIACKVLGELGVRGDDRVIKVLEQRESRDTEEAAGVRAAARAALHKIRD